MGDPIRHHSARTSVMAAARTRAMLARRFPCECMGRGCDVCGHRGHLGDRVSHAQTIVTPGPIRAAGTTSPADRVRASLGRGALER